MRKTFAFFVIALVVISAYLIFQCSNVVSYNNFSRGVVLATRLLDIEFLDVSSATLAKGYFTSLLTFENPTNQTENMTSLGASYYQTSAPLTFRVALGSIAESMKLGPGKTSVILQMNLETNASLAQPSYWEVKYRLNFGSVHYSFTSSTFTSVIKTSVPFSTGEEQVFPQVATYTLLVADVWAIGLEAIAVLILLQERIDKLTTVPKGQEHNKMLATIYTLQGIGLFVFWPLVFYLRDSVVSEPPAEFPYGLHGAAGIAATFLIGSVFLASLIFLGIAFGLLHGQRVAGSAALFLSSVSAFW